MLPLFSDDTSAVVSIALLTAASIRSLCIIRASLQAVESTMEPDKWIENVVRMKDLKGRGKPYFCGTELMKEPACVSTEVLFEFAGRNSGFPEPSQDGAETMQILRGSNGLDSRYIQISEVS